MRELTPTHAELRRTLTPSRAHTKTSSNRIRQAWVGRALLRVANMQELTGGSEHRRQTHTKTCDRPEPESDGHC
eukprot:3929218-Prymnesium_polylepis.2